MRISDWSSDVCSSDLLDARRRDLIGTQCDDALVGVAAFSTALFRASSRFVAGCPIGGRLVPGVLAPTGSQQQGRSEEHTSELQSLMRISYAVFCLKIKISIKTILKRRQSLNVPRLTLIQ